MRILIAGIPKAGKTTYSERLKIETGNTHELIHTDDMIEGNDWHHQSENVKELFNKEGDWIIEGSTVVRALRKWLGENTGKPCDQLIWMGNAKTELIPGQIALSKGTIKVMKEIYNDLTRRGVIILQR